LAVKSEMWCAASRQSATSTTSSAKRRRRCRVVAARFAQVAGLDILKLVSSPEIRVVSRDSLLTLRPRPVQISLCKNIPLPRDEVHAHEQYGDVGGEYHSLAIDSEHDQTFCAEDVFGHPKPHNLPCCNQRLLEKADACADADGGRDNDASGGSNGDDGGLDGENIDGDGALDVGIGRIDAAAEFSAAPDAVSCNSVLVKGDGSADAVAVFSSPRCRLVQLCALPQVEREAANLTDGMAAETHPAEPPAPPADYVTGTELQKQLQASNSHLLAGLGEMLSASIKSQLDSIHDRLDRMEVEAVKFEARLREEMYSIRDTFEARTAALEKRDASNFVATAPKATSCCPRFMDPKFCRAGSKCSRLHG